MILETESGIRLRAFQSPIEGVNHYTVWRYDVPAIDIVLLHQKAGSVEEVLQTALNKIRGK